MARFGPLELARLALVRADVVANVKATMDQFENQTGHKSYVISGWRSTDEQTETKKEGDATGFRAAPANKSRHPLGAAVDLGIVGLVRDAATDQADDAYATLAKIGVANGLVAGLNFKDKSEPDPYHFEASETLEVSQAKWAALVKERRSRAIVFAAVAFLIVVLIVAAVKLRHKTPRSRLADHGL